MSGEKFSWDKHGMCGTGPYVVLTITGIYYRFETYEKMMGNMENFPAGTWSWRKE
jgi:hypothetical protein